MLIWSSRVVSQFYLLYFSSENSVLALTKNFFLLSMGEKRLGAQIFAQNQFGSPVSCLLLENIGWFKDLGSSTQQSWCTHKMQPRGVKDVLDLHTKDISTGQGCFKPSQQALWFSLWGRFGRRYSQHLLFMQLCTLWPYPSVLGWSLICKTWLNGDLYSCCSLEKQAQVTLSLGDLVQSICREKHW